MFFCTKSGSISYLSNAHSGSATNRFITEDINIAAEFRFGYFVLLDKGFNVQNLFLQYKLTARILPFAASKKQLPPSEVAVGKRIVKARFHIERLIYRLKRVLDTISYFTINSC